MDNDMRQEIEQLREALADLLWYVGQLEILAYSLDDTGEHEIVVQARAVLSRAKKEPLVEG